MKKRKLIILVSCIAFSLLCFTAFAAFILTTVVDGTGRTGDIYVQDKTFLTYGCIDDSKAPNDYIAVGTSAFDDMALYYTRESGEGTSASPYLYKPVEVTSANFDSLKSKLYYHKTVDKRASVASAVDATSITCYATKKGNYTEEREYPYLNQLGMKFSFTTDISVYLRIHISDAWISQKVYNNGTSVVNYVKKGTVISGGVSNSPFKPQDTDNWVYDENTNCVYFKSVIDPKSDTYQSLLKDGKVTFTFDVENDYFYNVETSYNYRESIMVQVSFYVDIVQANRAERKWDVNLAEILGSDNVINA